MPDRDCETNQPQSPEAKVIAGLYQEIAFHKGVIARLRAEHATAMQTTRQMIAIYADGWEDAIADAQKLRQQNQELQRVNDSLEADLKAHERANCAW